MVKCWSRGAERRAHRDQSYGSLKFSSRENVAQSKFGVSCPNIVARSEAVRPRNGVGQLFRESALYRGCRPPAFTVTVTCTILAALGQKWGRVVGQRRLRTTPPHSGAAKMCGASGLTSVLSPLLGGL